MVSALRREWAGAVELDVTVEGGTVRALAYPALTGRPEPGDEVLLNTTALALGLGTGGYALVVAVPERLPADPAGPGHLVKARYTPLQATVRARTSRARRTTRRSATRTTWTACRWWSPTCIRRCPRCWPVFTGYGCPARAPVPGLSLIGRGPST